MFSGKARPFDPKIDPKTFLTHAGLGRTLLQYRKNKAILTQGEPSDAVFYIQEGRARLHRVEHLQLADPASPASGSRHAPGCAWRPQE
jgi:CRP-like cAMP-binding protein